MNILWHFIIWKCLQMLSKDRYLTEKIQNFFSILHGTKNLRKIGKSLSQNSNSTVRIWFDSIYCIYVVGLFFYIIMIYSKCWRHYWNTHFKMDGKAKKQQKVYIAATVFALHLGQMTAIMSSVLTDDISDQRHKYSK